MDLYYKALFHHIYDNRLLSMMGGFQEVYYKIGEFVYPRVVGSKLFVFKDLDIAKRYSKIIYSCEVVNPVIQMKVLPPFRLQEMYIKRFWSDGNIDYTIDAPEGSYCCDAVKLIEKIK